MVACSAAAIACGASVTSVEDQRNATASHSAATSRDPHLIVLGINDVHGHVARLSLLSGYIGCIEEQHPDAELMLLDGGDLFQGTLESNLNEGLSVIEIYNALGVTASAVGNHEFDFGPVGEDATASKDTDDPRGALKARIAQAEFPFLSANLVEESTGRRPDWPNLFASMVVEKAGFRVGLVGLATSDTLRTTISANVRGLRIEPPGPVLQREANALRKAGAELVIGVGHIGGKCSDFSDPEDLSSCDQDEELFALLESLPRGTVDAFVGGHTHQRVAHVINGTVAIESGARLSHLGRFDIVEKTGTHAITPMTPEATCAEGESCLYRGCDVRAHVRPEVSAIAERYLAQAQEKRDVALGVRAATDFEQVQDEQSALGNLLADLILETHPQADLAIMNGGGIRAPLRKGALHYGDFFEVFPFDNRFARIKMTGAELEKVFMEELLRAHHSVLSIAGMTVRASCKKGKPSIDLRTTSGEKLLPKKIYQIVTSDFLATGGDGAFVDANIQIEGGKLMRDAMVDALKKRKKALRADDARLTEPRYPERGVYKSCGDSAKAK